MRTYKQLITPGCRVAANSTAAMYAVRTSAWYYVVHSPILVLYCSIPTVHCSTVQYKLVLDLEYAVPLMYQC